MTKELVHSSTRVNCTPENSGSEKTISTILIDNWARFYFMICRQKGFYSFQNGVAICSY